MDKEIIIKVSKCLLILTEPELLNCLASKPDIFQRAIGRGKGYTRAVNSNQRQAEGFDRWQMYEALKGNRSIDDSTVAWVQGMSHKELVEGVSAYIEKMRQMPKEG